MEKALESKGRFPYLHEDIFFIILSFLPLKSICRFKAVSKNWLKLITNPVFSLELSRHARGAIHARGKPSLIFMSTSDSPLCFPDPSLTFIPGNYIWIIASTNGLFFLCFRQTHHCNMERSRYCVCNPATKERHIIPYYHKLSFLPSRIFGFAFDPSTSPSRYSIVYPYEKRNGKVRTYGFHVFSSDIGKWMDLTSMVTVPFICRIQWDLRKSVFVEGVLYWDCVDYMLSFNPDRVQANIVMLPFRKGYNHILEIGAWEGRVTCTRIDYMNSDLEVWVMRICAGSIEWECLHRVNLESIIQLNQDIFSSSFDMNFEIPLNGQLSMCDMQTLPYDGGESLYLRFKNKSVDEEIVVSYRVKTGEVKRFFTMPTSNPLGQRDQYRHVVSYCTSMVALPKLNVMGSYPLSLLLL